MPGEPELSAPDFSIVVLPDSQVYLNSHPEIFNKQLSWIKESKEKYNIKYVLHLGDVVTYNNHAQWKEVKKAFRQLKGTVPYLFTLGNHDLGTTVKTSSRNSLFYDYFPKHARAGKSFYDGKSFDRGNTYRVFKEKTFKGLILSLELCPRDKVIAWANNILKRYLEYKVIILTHAFLNSSASHYGGSLGSGKEYPVCKANNTNDAKELWAKLISTNRNIFLVLNGHFMPPPRYRKDIGDFGNIVHQMMVNFQDQPLGGEGYLRLLKFHLEADVIEVADFSPYLEQTRTAPSGYFRVVF